MIARRPVMLAVVVAGLCASGCSTVGNGRMAQLDAVQAAALLVPGRTTQDEVRQALGQGTVIRFRSGRETWHYLYRKGIAPGWDDLPYIGLITSRLDRPTKELVILFDGAGVLRRWSMQEFRTAPSKGA